MNVKIFIAILKVTPVLQKHKCHYSASCFVCEILMAAVHFNTETHGTLRQGDSEVPA
jgi:hypothetical protein